MVHLYLSMCRDQLGRGGRYRNECRLSDSGILHVRAPIFRKNVEIRTLAQDRATSVSNLCGYDARRTGGLSEAETAGSLVPTESDEPMPQKERCRGGGLNGVCDFSYGNNTASSREA